MRIRRASLGLLVAPLLLAAPARAQTDPEQTVPVPPGDEYADTDPSALTDFRTALDPNGTWQDDPSYGTVWTPDPAQVGSAFQPYDTEGSWDYADGDPVWVSNYSWGWVCFHYGRWAWSGARWVWIPGREYAGAWVNWRMGDDGFGYVGWAPMPPSWVWWQGSPTMLGFQSVEPWLFSEWGQFLAADVGSRAVPGNRAGAIASHTHPYVRAQPHVVAAPVPQGPPAAALGIDVSRAALPPLSAREVRARQLGRSSTALALGAHAPTPHIVRAAPRTGGAARGAPAMHAVPSRGRR